MRPAYILTCTKLVYNSINTTLLTYFTVPFVTWPYVKLTDFLRRLYLKALITFSDETTVAKLKPVICKGNIYLAAAQLKRPKTEDHANAVNVINIAIKPTAGN